MVYPKRRYNTAECGIDEESEEGGRLRRRYSDEFKRLWVWVLVGVGGRKTVTTAVWSPQSLPRFVYKTIWIDASTRIATAKSSYEWWVDAIYVCDWSSKLK